MKLTKPALKTLAALIVIIFLGARGWTSARDLEKRSFVLAIGFDADPSGGFKGHFHIVVPRAITTGGGESGGGGGGGGGGQKPVLVVTATAPSLWEVRQAIQEKVNNPLFLGHLQAIVVGENLARRGIRQVLDTMLRTAEIRRRAWIMVAEGPAEKVLATMPKLEPVPSLYLARILETEDYLRLIPMLRLSEFLALEANPGEEPVAIMLKSEQDTVFVSGLAVFKGDRLVGKLNTPEMHHFLLAAMGRGLMPERIKSPDGEGELVYLITGAKRTIRPFVQGNKVSFSIRVRLEGNIMEKSAPHSLDDEEYLRAVEAALSEKIERDCRTVLRHFQKEFRTDAYGFGNILRARYPKVWQELDWEKEFPDVPINIRVEAKIRRLGMAAN
jgi:Ger(x)C family germination protein